MSQRSIVIMGVCGCGKSTVAKMLADRIGWRFLDADDYHPPANRSKLEAGIALTDQDRWPWIEKLAKMLEQEPHTVLACSALRHIYRVKLQAFVAIDFVLLNGSYQLISERLKSRTGHFMNPQLLSSQFEALEVPSDALALDISHPAEQLVKQIIVGLNLANLTA